MSIAGQTGLIQGLYESTGAYFAKYLSEKAEDFSFAVTQDHLAFEQAQLDEEALQEGLRRRAFTGPFLERAAIQRAFARHLLQHQTLLLHGSTVAVDGRAYLFTARCGTGKSTHTRLWREHFGDRAVMVNDDKPFLRITEDAVTAFGSPWSGKHGLDTNMAAPLQGICILERGREDRIFPISAEEALPMLLHQSFWPQDAAAQEMTRQLVDKLAKTVPLWRMECTISPEAAAIAHEAMAANAK